MPLEMLGEDRHFLRSRRRRIVDPQRSLRVVDLFSGCGGLTLGVEEAARQLGLGVDVRLAAELDQAIAATYAENFDVQENRLAGDVRACFDRSDGRALSKTERATVLRVGRRVDWLVGGPPCQGHSTLNNHTRGDDPKNALYLAMVRAAEVLEPRAILIENVPAIERDRSGVVKRTCASLDRLGYKVATRIVSVAEIGVPQLRTRHLLVAHARHIPDISAAVSAARLANPRDLRWAISDLKVEPRSLMDTPAKLSPENQRRAMHLLKTGQHDLPNRLRPRCQRGDHKYKSMYGRLRWDEPAQTITTGFGSPGQGRYLHPIEPRTLTPHEAARIQFFPDWFDFGRLAHRRWLAKAIGNAVPPKLAFVLAHHVLGLDFRRDHISEVGALERTRPVASAG